MRIGAMIVFVGLLLFVILAAGWILHGVGIAPQIDGGSAVVLGLVSALMISGGMEWDYKLSRKDK